MLKLRHKLLEEIKMTSIKKFLSCVFVFLVLIVALVSCNILDDSPQGTIEAPEYNDQNAQAHEHNYGEWSVIVEPSCTKEGLRERICVCGNKQSETLPKSHLEISDKGRMPTDTYAGLTEGKHCSACGTVTVSQKEIPFSGYEAPLQYQSTYGYNFLGTMEKGAQRQELYEALDVAAITFHVNTEISSETDNVVETISFDGLNLTADEAVSVWTTYKNDHPLYYWISPSVSVEGTNLLFLTSEEYANGETRKELNTIIYNAVETKVNSLSGNETLYQTALAFHDTIIFETDYAYESDGYTPKDDAVSHNILGVFDEKSGVCEAYAKSFQLLLNFCKIENVFVSGRSNDENHAWNMAQMDDGKWYWFDLTWDDSPGWMWGIKYNYFCVNDTQNVNWRDGGWTTDESSFMNDHSPFSPLDSAEKFLYALPERSSSIFDAEDGLVLRESFSADGFTYEKIGYRTLQLKKISLNGDVQIPETVTYNGDTYTVISITDRSLIDSNYHTVTSITIPASIKFIWDNTFSYQFLENIFVVDNNPYFSSKDGVLFTKSFYTLIQYPSGSNRTEYILPEETEIIAYCAFNAHETKLTKISLGKNFSYLGRANWGGGYIDSSSEDKGGNIVSGGWEMIYDFLSGEKEIIVSKENPNYISDGIALYSKGGSLLLITDRNIKTYQIPKNIDYIESNSDADTVLSTLENLEKITVEEGNTSFYVYENILYNKDCEIIAVPKKIKGNIQIKKGVKEIDKNIFGDCTEITGIIIPDSVTTIGDWAFWGCTSLKNIIIPDSVTSIGSTAFADCINLESITIPNKVTSIESSTFSGCTNLKNITIPDSIKTIEAFAFSDCTNLKEITFLGTPAQWNSIEKDETWNIDSAICNIKYVN